MKPDIPTDAAELVQKFREALETLNRSEWGDAWPEASIIDDNPTAGICDVAHQVLARLLVDRFNIQASMISGEKGNRMGKDNFASHRWLRINKTYVDVTGGKKVEISDNPTFHKEWNGKDIGTPDFNDSWWFTYCAKAYQDISEYLG